MSPVLKSGIIILAFAFASIANSASAGILAGNTVQLDYEYTDIDTGTNVVLDGPIDKQVFVGSQNQYVIGGVAILDLSDTNLTATGTLGDNSSWAALPFNGFHLFDAYNQVAAFTGVSLNAATNLAGFDISRVTFDDDNVWINWQGLGGAGVVSVDLQTGSAPEPASWALMISGLGLAGAALRRRAARVLAS